MTTHLQHPKIRDALCAMITGKCIVIRSHICVYQDIIALMMRRLMFLINLLFTTCIKLKIYNLFCLPVLCLVVANHESIIVPGYNSMQ